MLSKHKTLLVYFSFNENNFLYHLSGVGKDLPSEEDISENTGVKIDDCGEFMDLQNIKLSIKKCFILK